MLYLFISSYTNYTFDKILPYEISVFDRSDKSILIIQNVFVAHFASRWLFLYARKIWNVLLNPQAHLFGYLTSPGAFVEMLWFSWFAITLAGCSLRYIDRVESDNSSYLFATATAMQYILFLTYLRPFPMFGPLIGMIEGIIWDIRYYLIFIALIIFGFSQAMYLVAYGESSADDGLGFGTPGGSLAQTFVLFVGNPSFPPNYGGSSQSSYFSNNAFPIFLEIMMVTIGSILMLNLLIAIMSNTYNRIKKHDESEWLKQLCITISNQKYLFPYKPDKFIHFLRRKIDVDRESVLKKKKKEFWSSVIENER